MAHSFLTRHLHDANENYFVHLAFTIRAWAALWLSGLLILIHGLLPFAFTHTGSCMVKKLYEEMEARRGACKDAQKS